MEDCKDCNKSFAEEHQGLIEDVCFLKNIAFADIFVRTSESDPTSGYLSEKIVGTSGLTIVEETNGVSGNFLSIGFDLNFLDDRYIFQNDTLINFPLNGGIRNGKTCLELLDGIESIRLSQFGIPLISWNTKIPNYYNGSSLALSIDWTAKESVSGYVFFEIDYNSVASNEILDMIYSSSVSGFFDGTINKMINTKIDLPNIFDKEDQFLLKLTRQSQNINDTLDTSVNLIGVSLIYN